MANEVRLLVTQALDERDLLNKKINDKIMSAVFVDVVKHNEETVLNRRVDRETFRKEAQSSFQQINDLIERYKNIEAAIVESNANTFIETSYGKFSIAAAIALRNRLRGDLKFNGKADFETTLYQKMQDTYDECVMTMEIKNRALAETAEQMRLSILGKETKVKNDKPLEIVETYVKENSMELADPLNIVSKMEQLQERKDKLLSELETQIKVSNATTFIVLNA